MSKNFVYEINWNTLGRKFNYLVNEFILFIGIPNNSFDVWQFKSNSLQNKLFFFKFFLCVICKYPGKSGSTPETTEVEIISPLANGFGTV